MVLPYYRYESATGMHVSPILNPPPSSLPVPSLWVVPVHQPQASSIVHQTWTGNSFHIWYYTYFNAILPNHPTLSLSPMFIAALFIIARTWKQPRCPSADEWIRKLWYIYTMEYYSAIKNNTFESVLMRWMKLKPFYFWSMFLKIVYLHFPDFPLSVQVKFCLSRNLSIASKITNIFSPHGI